MVRRYTFFTLFLSLLLMQSSDAQYLEHVRDFSLGVVQGVGDACLSASVIQGAAWLIGSEKSFANSFVHSIGWGSQFLRVLGPSSDTPFVLVGTINKDGGTNYADGIWLKNPFGKKEDIKRPSTFYSATYYTSFFCSMVALGILSTFWSQKPPTY